MTNGKILLLNEIKIAPNDLNKTIDIWMTHFLDNNNDERCLYLSGDDILEVTVCNDDSSLNNCIHDSLLLNLENKLVGSLLSDWKRQIIKLIDVVKPQIKLLPNTPYLQLRHIEVPLSQYQKYIEWRRKTIFAYVKNNAKVESFQAYHSILSTEPGVTFFSGFSCNEAEYLSSFNTEEYQQIIKEAGNQYICGGEKSLYTKIYQNLLNTSLGNQK